MHRDRDLSGDGRSSYFWGGASWREHQILQPNEAIFWHAMRYWKERGVMTFDMGGGGDYKRKYGGAELVVPHLSGRGSVPSTMRGAVRQPAGRVASRAASTSRAPLSR